MKIYLAGPMTGLPRFNWPTFDRAAEVLRAEGHQVFSPAEHTRRDAPFMDSSLDGDHAAAAAKGFNRRASLGADLAWICSEADAVALLPGWEKSTGAISEQATAVALGLTVIILGVRYLAVPTPPVTANPSPQPDRHSIVRNGDDGGAPSPAPAPNAMFPNATFYSFKKSGKYYETGRGTLTKGVYQCYTKDGARTLIVKHNGGCYPGLSSSGDEFIFIVLPDEGLEFGYPLMLFPPD